MAFESLLNPWRISARFLNINTLNVVSDDSDIVYACRNGVVDSVLQWALFRGEYEITRLILEHSPDGTHLSTWNNWNCLMYLLQGAQQFDKGSAYSLADFLMLLNRDDVLIDTSSTDDTEMQALELAACWYSGDIISRILALGAPITLLSSNPWGYPRNPILYSIYKSDFASFQALLTYYKDLNAKDADGYTMLSYTARAGNVEMTDLLLKMGAEEIIPNYRATSKDGGDDLIEKNSDSEGREKSETTWDATGLIIDEWVGPWTAENYEKYMKSLEQYGKVVITRSRDGSESNEIFWDIITN
ncbi:unnamed protein product [Clonostachys rhizophaga]|uniref:Ankyrin n=1 Tax=Clonostachys rhizophaga TaxID=160324 RepID=A0A9N9YPI3_9HYPO|nr:unnamed protein product [Clonostachys rhizophaga]